MTIIVSIVGVNRIEFYKKILVYVLKDTTTMVKMIHALLVVIPPAMVVKSIFFLNN